MKKLSILLSAFLLITCFSCQTDSKSGKEKVVLVFSKTAGYHHQSIPDGMEAVQKLGIENGFKVDTTTNAALFTAQNLEKYDAVIFLSTTGDVLNSEQEKAFENYIKSGGGYVGVHAAADTEYEWPWYGKLVGAYFLSHPKIQEAVFQIKDHDFAATSFLESDTWVKKDELYNYKDINPDIHVVMTIDESSYEGGENGDFHPMSWYHAYDGGRAFYTAMGHTKESYTDADFLKHFLGGIQYAMGEK